MFLKMKGLLSPFRLGIGCTSCECNENGTIGGACDTNTGQCVCHDEVEGFKCDMCKEDFYGLNTLGHCTGNHR